MTSPLLSMRCPVCDGRSFAHGPHLFDDRYGQPQSFELACCTKCAHLATHPRLSEADLSQLYGKYYPRKSISAEQVRREAARVTNPFAALRRWWNGTDNQGQYGVQPGQAMLDVGCGSGASLLEAQALGARAFGIEADPNVGPIAQALGLTVHLGSLDDQPFAGQVFDLIVLNQVLEHLPDPDAVLIKLLDRLAPRGRLVLVVPNTDSLGRRLSGQRWINWHVPYHQHHFNKHRLDRLAVRCGLKMRRSRTITPNIWTLLQMRALFDKPRIGQPSPIWAVQPAKQQAVTAPASASPLKVLVRSLVMTAIATVNRGVDALGQGDSLLVELQRGPRT